MMKTTKFFLALTAFWLVSLAASAQAPQEYVWMFKTFQMGEIHFKSGSPLKYKLNYDLKASRLHYMQNGTMMELTDATRIDTVFVAGCKLVPVGLSFCEAVTSAQGHNVLIERTARNVKVGSIGLFGVPTQINVYTTKVDAGLGTATNELSAENDIMRQIDECSYHIVIDGKRTALKKQSQFVALFPKEKQKPIKTFAKQQHLNFGTPIDFLQLLDYALAL